MVHAKLSYKLSFMYCFYLYLPSRQHCTDYSTWTGRWWASQGRRSAVNPREKSGPSEWSTGSTAQPTPPSTRLWRLWPLVCRAHCRNRTGECSSQSVLTRCTGQVQIPRPDTLLGGEDGGQAGRVGLHLPDPPYTCGCGRFEVGRGCSWAPEVEIWREMSFWLLFELIYMFCPSFCLNTLVSLCPISHIKQTYPRVIFVYIYAGCSCDDVTHLRPYEAKLVEHWEAFSLDGKTHATTGTDGDGNLVCAHWHIDWAQEELEENGNTRLQVEYFSLFYTS